MTPRRPVAVDPGRIVAHLADPELAVRAEVDGDRVEHQGSDATNSTRNPFLTRMRAEGLFGDFALGASSLALGLARKPFRHLFVNRGNDQVFNARF